jgi:hypothetical protein
MVDMGKHLGIERPGRCRHGKELRQGLGWAHYTRVTQAVSRVERRPGRRTARFGEYLARLHQKGEARLIPPLTQMVTFLGPI